MVVLRLSRAGTSKSPFYYLIVTDSRKPRDSGYIERLGYYNPFATEGENHLKIDQKRLSYWLSVGAKPSKKISYLLKEQAELSKTKPFEEEKKIKRSKKSTEKKVQDKTEEAETSTA